MKKSTLFFLVIFYCFHTVVYAQENNSETINKTKTILQNAKNGFIENKGQWPAEVLFLAKMSNTNCWITTKGIVYDHYVLQAKQTEQSNSMKKRETNLNITGHVYSASYMGKNSAQTVEKKSELNGIFNYFIGPREKWASKVKRYNEIVIQNVYPGIDVRYYFEDNSLRYDFIVAPYADASQISIQYQGQDKLTQSSAGEIAIETSLGTIRHSGLKTFQKQDGNKIPINSGFELRNENLLKFNIGEYDKSKELIIDPIVLATYLGGEESDELIGIDVNQLNSHVLVTGQTYCSDYPYTIGAYKKEGEGYDVLVTEINTLGERVFSTVIGGSGQDRGIDCKFKAYNTSGPVFVPFEGLNTYIYIAGDTKSSNFPVTEETAYSDDYANCFDMFFLVLSPNGSSLLYSTFIGGAFDDYTEQMEIDYSTSSPVAYIVGNSQSDDFPAKNGGDEHLGTSNGTIVVFNPIKIGLASCLFAHSFCMDSDNTLAVFANALAKDPFSNSIVTVGYYFDLLSQSLTYAFVYKVTPDYIGEKDIQIPLRNYFATNLPTYPRCSAFDVEITSQNTYMVSGEKENAGWLAELNPSALPGENMIIHEAELYSLTILTDLEINYCGQIYAYGTTNSNSFLKIGGAYCFQNGYGGGSTDALLCKYNNDLSQMTYFTYIGGKKMENHGGLTNMNGLCYHYLGNGNAELYMCLTSGYSGLPVINNGTDFSSNLDFPDGYVCGISLPECNNCCEQMFADCTPLENGAIEVTLYYIPNLDKPEPKRKNAYIVSWKI